MKILAMMSILTFSSFAFGQKSVASLNPKHAAALEQFLSKNKQYQFLREGGFDEEPLKLARNFYGKNLTPYYKVGDFNHDRILDFALILSRKGDPKRNDPSVDSEPHKYLFPLAVVIFNGNKNGNFEKAFIEEVEEPLVCFLGLSSGKKKSLTFRVFQTDDGFNMTAAGKGYIVE